MRLADFLSRRLQFLGIEHAFMVTGGAAMHLNDAIASTFKNKLVFLHHEQSCSMAADSYARILNKPCLVNITAGPGAINALNGVFGAYVDSLPMFVLSGQSKRATLAPNSGIKSLRQLGDQEANVVSLASSAVQYSKLLLTVGSRLNIRQISYNWKSFSPHSWKCHVDIDQAELDKPTLSSDLKILCDVKYFFPLLSDALYRVSSQKNINISTILSHWDSWTSWLKSSLLNYSVLQDLLPPTNGTVNPYRLISKLSESWSNNSIIVCSDGTACVAGFQAAVIKPYQRIFHNSGCASMGFELPAAIGAYHASHQLITCLAGDGSIMMNLQELAIIGGNNYPIKIILLNNNGYHSIRQTQTNYFPDNIVGCGPDSGLPFPDFRLLSNSFGIDYLSVCDEDLLDDAIQALYSSNRPQLLEVSIDQTQQFSPKLSSRRLPSGEMVSPSLEDMSPHLPQHILSLLSNEAFSIRL